MFRVQVRFIFLKVLQTSLTIKWILTDEYFLRNDQVNKEHRFIKNARVWFLFTRWESLENETSEPSERVSFLIRIYMNERIRIVQSISHAVMCLLHRFSEECVTFLNPIIVAYPGEILMPFSIGKGISRCVEISILIPASGVIEPMYSSCSTLSSKLSPEYECHNKANFNREL